MAHVKPRDGEKRPAEPGAKTWARPTGPGRKSALVGAGWGWAGASASAEQRSGWCGSGAGQAWRSRKHILDCPRTWEKLVV